MRIIKVQSYKKNIYWQNKNVSVLKKKRLCTHFMSANSVPTGIKWLYSTVVVQCFFGISSVAHRRNTEEIPKKYRRYG